MNTKILLASVAVAVVAAALVNVAAAEFASQTPIANQVNGQIEPPYVTGDYSQVPEWCVNATTGEPYRAQNGAGYGWNGTGDGAYQNGYAYEYGCGVGEEGQYRYGGVGRGSFGCGW